MFYAETTEGLRISVLKSSLHEIKQLSKDGLVRCPDCFEQVVFRSGSKRRPHFAHKNSECTYPYHEPETPEHQEGKLQLLKRLEELYPSAMVELEYKVMETNQRSDVMVIHPNGDKWAFEFQCSKIPSEIWLKRRELYQSAGVLNFWILGGSVHNYGRTDGGEDRFKHRLCDLEQIINQDCDVLHYLNVEDSENVYMRVLEDGDIAKSIFYGFDYTCKLSDAYVIGDRWWTDDLEEKLKRTREQEELEEQREAYWELRELQLKEERRQQKRERYIALMNQRDSFTDNFIPSEKEMFRKLCSKHSFSKDTFPGLLHLDVKYSDLIQTPPQLWQLWIYDRFIHNKRNSRPKIWVKNIYELFREEVGAGLFRINGEKAKETEHAHYSFAIFRFIDYLAKAGMLVQLGHRRVYYQILKDEIIHFDNRKDNILQKITLEEYYIWS